MNSINQLTKYNTKSNLAALQLNGKTPPQATELEEAVLGALMLEKEALNDVIEILKPDSFYKENHKHIYEAIISLFGKSEPIDLLTVINELRRLGKLEISGGSAYIAQLTTRVNSAANVVFYARVVLEQAIKRELISVASEIERDSFEDVTDVFQLLDRMQQSLFDISERNIRKNYQDMQTLMGQAFVELETRKNRKDGLTGVPTGLKEFDRVTSGWQKSDLVILAARPAMGKCLGKGTKVVMFDGSLRNVEDVKVGDLLMGDDSKARKVLSLARGQEMMYWIKQNRSIAYRVNESHILSLKRSRNEGKHKNGDVLNIEVKDYLTKSDKFKSNYKGYKVAVEFESQSLEKLPITPYFLGLWLGDGHSYSSRITTTDSEVVDYMHEYATELNLTNVVYQQKDRCNNYEITKGNQGGNQNESQAEFSLQSVLRKLNLLQNKHIPEQYLINSTQNRLALLAGLIDSDGSYLDYACGYEITQKNKKLAEQIKFLCDSLGFRTTIRSKKATIKDRNFETEVYRVRFYGDVNKIPVRIARKKARTWNSKVDWQLTGIQVIADKVDDYYGFEIDGNRLFLLEDMTVTHNTAFALSILRNAAVLFQKPVAIFSLEMSSLQLVNRLISAEAELESDKLKTGKIADFEWEQIIHKTAALTEAPIFIDDTPAISILELRAKCRRLKSQHDIQLIIIDYLQLMTGDTGKGGSGNREQEIASISRALKQLAKELNVPVVALSQLSRAVETRGGDKKPQLSDLRESGSIEQDADMVLFLYRPEYYDLLQDENGNSTVGMGQVIIAKHRNGSLDTVNLKFVGKFTKFTNLDDADNISAGTYSSAFNNSSIPNEFDVNTNNNLGNEVILGSKMNGNYSNNTNGNDLSYKNTNDDEVPF
jgi:replicative DNA helicase